MLVCYFRRSTCNWIVHQKFIKDRIVYDLVVLKIGTSGDVSYSVVAYISKNL